MTLNLSVPTKPTDLKPRIVVIGVGGAGGNAVNNMIRSNLEGVECAVANTDAQALSQSLSERRIQLGRNITHGLGAGSRPDIGRAAAEEGIDEILEHLQGCHMLFIAAGMGGGTGTGAGPVIARAARDQGILTVGVVTKPFHFEGPKRMTTADAGIEELQHYVDTLIVIPNQNLFRVATEKTTFADAFKMADDVLYDGVRGVTDLMVMPGLVNLDFADIRTVMSEMGKAMMGAGEADGQDRARQAAEQAIANPLLDDVSMKGAHGVLINITGGMDMTLYEVDEAVNRIRDEVDTNANIIFGSTFDDALEGKVRVSIFATGIDAEPVRVDESKNARIRLVSRAGETSRIDVEDQEPQSASETAVSEEPEDEPWQQYLEADQMMAVGNVAAAGGGFADHSVYQDESPVPATADSEAAEDMDADLALGAGATMEPDPVPSGGYEIPPATPESGIAAEPAGGDRPELFDVIHGGNSAENQDYSAETIGEIDVPEAVSEPSSPRVDPQDRAPISQEEEDLLDIPAFLRRQAN